MFESLIKRKTKIVVFCVYYSHYLYMVLSSSFNPDKNNKEYIWNGSMFTAKPLNAVACCLLALQKRHFSHLNIPLYHITDAGRNLITSSVSVLIAEGRFCLFYWERIICSSMETCALMSAHSCLFLPKLLPLVIGMKYKWQE